MISVNKMIDKNDTGKEIPFEAIYDDGIGNKIPITVLLSIEEIGSKLLFLNYEIQKIGGKENETNKKDIQ